MKKQEEKFSTLDANLASYLALHEIPIALERINDRIIFTAQQSKELFQASESFYANDYVRVMDFVNALKILKTRMFVAKGVAK
jgi:hypothetical protein